jgi:predicted flap endonuclease-1-like 5' DNA nuclease
MPELLQEYWLLALVALAIASLMAFWLFHATRRTKVALDERSEDSTARRNQALIDAPPVAPLAGVPAPLSTSPVSDDLGRIKGVGPKLVAILNELGITSFDQIATWDHAAIERIDAQLGRFEGRIRRDDWVEQARLLAAEDLAGYEARFGKV